MSSSIPQIIVTLSPEGTLQAEIPIGAHRRIVALSEVSAGKKLAQLLREEGAKIKAREAAAEGVPTRKLRWRRPEDLPLVLAKHPQAEIREVRIQHLPEKGKDTGNQRSHKTLEELGL